MNYKSYVGPIDIYDLISANQFNLLTKYGLRENHYLLDIGCGSLRGGKLFIPYLLPERYYGIEPYYYYVQEGIKNELGFDILDVKKPKFNDNENFQLSIFDRKFDYILAQSIFSHAAEKHILKCLEEARRVMKKESLFFATFCEGKSNYKDNKWVYPSKVEYTFNFINNLCRKIYLECKRLNYRHPGGQTWIKIKRI